MKKTVFFVFAICILFSATVSAEPLFDQIYFKTRTTLVPGTYTLRFSIWSDAKKGEMVWSEDQTITTTDSTIEAILGDVTPLPDIDYSLQWYVQADNIIGTKAKAISKTREILEASPVANWKIYDGNNFFAGIQTGNLTMTGEGNTATGIAALRNNTSGEYNTASGTAALYNNSSGRYNTAFGAGALFTNTTSYRNTAIGAYALESNTYFDNTASGYYALRKNTTGEGNTASGSHALTANTTGSVNTASGYYALYKNITGGGNTANGSDVLYNNTTGEGNTASGRNSLYSNTSGGYNTAFGYNAGDGNVSGSNNTFVGVGADVSTGNLSNATAIGNGAWVNASNKVVIGNTSVTSIGGYAAWSNFSDLRSKTDIQDIGYGLDLINALRPVSFKMKNGNNNTDFGFVAQDIEALLGSEYNVLDIGGGDERMLSLRYSQFIAPMVKAIQEQQTRINTLESRIEALEALLSNKN